MLRSWSSNYCLCKQVTYQHASHHILIALIEHDSSIVEAAAKSNIITDIAKYVMQTHTRTLPIHAAHVLAKVCVVMFPCRVSLLTRHLVIINIIITPVDLHACITCGHSVCHGMPGHTCESTDCRCGQSPRISLYSYAPALDKS